MGLNGVVRIAPRRYVANSVGLVGAYRFPSCAIVIGFRYRSGPWSLLSANPPHNLRQNRFSGTKPSPLRRCPDLLTPVPHRLDGMDHGPR